MSSFSKAGHLVSLLNKSDFKILKVFASSLKNRQFLNLPTLSQYSNLSQSLIEHHLKRLVKFGLISKSNIGYTLLVTGLDIYVLKILSNRNIITAIGPQIGIGKEAEVYLAHDSLEQDKILKMFRLGRSSFKQIKRKRDVNTGTNSWLLLNIETAKKEYDILTYLKDSSTSFPSPLYRSFHCIVMEPIYGSRLSDIEYLDYPELVLEKIISNMTIAYRKGYINGDINEYNILVNDDNISILDWPQAVRVDTTNADVVLTRDVNNIVKFFSRKFEIERDIHNIINIIKGK
ncbi:MAG: RIO1 family regulatory kinase/ATPase [Nitrososphaeraceae archaeon]|nr:RIO1 family regulatory kinase/ATPase [Nitrososphaeraceae archaeon]MDW0138352.1 RIO1 family regulatory kinase/ATPase [Nitrososphaeraceae archaeon]MDW0144383.1 RIO1 family regulatory kinase/ATPase [Nitrososphaeraceae archaeon]MDW0145150.1 RIO1 family regulatory kinase/ATPase [Nitrososphaeraceae archaeon]MDW0148659.1 RIO1 family regulatory kinase/ATPase [Nitrososphaeraceae archaeon]